MAKTKVADVIVPEIFTKYTINRTKELFAFYTSGVVTLAGVELGGDLKSGGNTIHMPFWNDLSGDDEVLSDSTPLTTDKITANQDIAVLHFRGKAWSSNDLAHQLAGDDPMRAIADLTAAWWSRKMQTLLLASLGGAFGTASMASNVSDISAATGDAANINAKTFVDATQKLGDAKTQLAAIAMHSATEASLAKLDLIETIKGSEGKPDMKLFMGKQVIVDDGLPVAGGVYTTYLFGAGAVGYNEGGVLTPVETDRDSLAGDDILINRRAFVMHPRGIKWAGASAGVSPTNAELAVGTNWKRVYEPKQIRIVQFKHKLAA